MSNWSKSGMKNEVISILYDLEQALKERPMTFICSDVVLHDTVTKIDYWVANGRGAGKVHHPFELKFGYFGSRKFHKMVDAWKAQWLSEKYNRDVVNIVNRRRGC